MLKKNNSTGFTIIELVIVCGIIAILSTVVALIFVNGRRLFTLQNYSVIAQDQALKASLVMERELREAQAPSGMGLPAIEAATTQSIIFYADVDDSSVQEEKIEYILSSGKLKRGIANYNSQTGSYNALPAIADMKTIADYIVNNNDPLFYYYADNYNGSQQAMAYPLVLGSIRVIRLKLKIDPNPNQPPEPYNYETVIQLRNL